MSHDGEVPLLTSNGMQVDLDTLFAVDKNTAYLAAEIDRIISLGAGVRADNAHASAVANIGDLDFIE